MCYGGFCCCAYVDMNAFPSFKLQALPVTEGTNPAEANNSIYRHAASDSLEQSYKYPATDPWIGSTATRHSELSGRAEERDLQGARQCHRDRRHARDVDARAVVVKHALHVGAAVVSLELVQRKEPRGDVAPGLLRLPCQVLACSSENASGNSTTSSSTQDSQI